MGNVHGNAKFCSSESDFLWRKEIGGRGGVVQKKGGAPVLVPNTYKTIEARSQAAIVRFSHLIVNIAAAVTLAGRH